MKKILLMLSMALSLLLVSCGRSGEDESLEFYDITRESIQMFTQEETATYSCVGTQYYQGEPIQLWTEIRNYEDENGTFCSKRDFYIHREDGSRELLLADIDCEGISYIDYWLDEEGRLFSLCSDRISAFDSLGNELFYTVTGENVDDICRLSDGRYILVARLNGEIRLAQLDIETGKIDVFQSIEASGGSNYIAPTQDGVLVISGQGVKKVNLENGQSESILTWNGSSYTWTGEWVGDLRQNSDGSVEILFKSGRMEKLKYENTVGNRTVISVRGTNFSNWFKERIVEFNQSDLEYYVVLEEREENVDMQSFREKTDIELAAGQGADIIFCGAVSDYYSLMQKGTFVNLQPYMEKSKLDESEYFSGTFLYDETGKNVYGVNLLIYVYSLWAEDEFLQDMKEVTIEEFVSALQNYESKRVLIEGWNPGNVLRLFLYGSENLWGMIDWEQGTCDFKGTFFADMVSVAEKYGDDDGNGYDALAGLLYRSDFYQCAYEDIDLEEQGKSNIGFFFDEGNFSRRMFTETVFINKNSCHKDGAWKVIQFLMGEEAQNAFGSDGLSFGFPANKAAFHKIEGELLAIVEEDKIGWAPFDKENMEKLEVEIENGMPFPEKTQPILDIIYEETSEYFSGVKSLEEVIAVIENRVQLYLDEIS